MTKAMAKNAGMISQVDIRYFHYLQYYTLAVYQKSAMTNATSTRVLNETLWVLTLLSGEPCAELAMFRGAGG